MAARLEIGKVVLGAFLVPWSNRNAFVRALAIPLLALVILSISWYYAASHLSDLTNWLLYPVYGAFFTAFAVTCHRLVLLDPATVASRIAPRWSLRESRFFFWMFLLWLMFMAIVFLLTSLMLNVWVPWVGEPQSWFGRMVFLAKVPALYLFARVCLIFPATAIDRRVTLRWAWRISENNGWRLAVVVGVLPWVISALVGLLYRESPSVAETILLTFVASALFAVEVAALSLSYQELTREEFASVA